MLRALRLSVRKILFCRLARRDAFSNGAGLGGRLVASFDDLLLIWPFPVRTGMTIVLERTRETSLSASEMVLRLFSHGAVAIDAWNCSETQARSAF